MRFEHKIKTLCRVLKVNRSTYYKHFSSPESARAKQDRIIKTYILTLHGKYKKRLGVLKMTLLLQREYGLSIGQTRVRRLLKAMNLPKIPARKIPPQKSKAACDDDFHNFLNRQFNPKEPNRIWGSDLTYLKVGAKWYYLCVIIDLFSRKVIAWQLSDKADSQLVIETFKKAYRNRNCPQGLMFHSDRGSQFTSLALRKLLDELNVVQSFSGKGCPFDNAVVEAFFKYLKAEETNRGGYSNRTDLHLSLFEYIESFYNDKRPHSAINFLSPNAFEDNFFSTL